jgi:hypothetical protein
MQNDNVYYTGSVVRLSPTYVGYLEIGISFRIALTKKPIWLHRKMMYLVFGWNWIDGKF